jgi:hypothetical protein
MSDNLYEQAENTWRVVPEFELYEINLLKDIRFAKTKIKFGPALTGSEGVKFYYLNPEPGVGVLMNADHILDVTFPELRN